MSLQIQININLDLDQYHKAVVARSYLQIALQSIRYAKAYLRGFRDNKYVFEDVSKIEQDLEYLVDYLSSVVGFVVYAHSHSCGDNE